MIKNKSDLRAFIKADAKANGVVLGGLKNKIKNHFNPIWQYILVLRKYEFHKNRKKTIFTYPLYLYYWFRYRSMCVKLSFTIPPNVCDEGLSLPHIGTIVINPAARIGKNCRLHVGINIGASGGGVEAPVIGENTYIAPGAKLYGGISIGNNCFVGANSVVNKSFPDNSVLVGVPAKLLRTTDTCWWKQNKLKL